jgi:hypothetical protein
MSTDFGLLVGRYDAAEPTIANDQELREIRLDVNGRAHMRLNDGNDNTLSYFADGDAVGSGVGNAAEASGDRGLIMLGLNETDSNYQMLRVNSDGSLAVSFQSGTDVSEAADSANAADGEITLAQGAWVKVQEIAVATGKIHVSGWSYASDKNTILQLTLSDDTGTDGHDRADITEILDTMLTTSARPSDHVSYNRSLSRSGGTNVAIVLWAKQLQAGANGVAMSMVNASTTT